MDSQILSVVVVPLLLTILTLVVTQSRQDKEYRLRLLVVMAILVLIGLLVVVGWFVRWTL